MKKDEEMMVRNQMTSVKVVNGSEENECEIDAQLWSIEEEDMDKIWNLVTEYAGSRNDSNRTLEMNLPVEEAV